MGLIVVHVAISLIGIGSGLVVLVGMLRGKRFDGWTAAFLASTAATSARDLRSQRIVFCPRTSSECCRCWCWVQVPMRAIDRNSPAGGAACYVVAAALALYLNVFVGVIQSFLKVPALRALAPTQSEPPFVITQLAVLAIFVGLSIAAVVKFRPEHTGSTHIKRMSVPQM